MLLNFLVRENLQTFLPYIAHVAGMIGRGLRVAPSVFVEEVQFACLLKIERESQFGLLSLINT